MSTTIVTRNRAAQGAALITFVRLAEEELYPRAYAYLRTHEEEIRRTAIAWGDATVRHLQRLRNTVEEWAEETGLNDSLNDPDDLGHSDMEIEEEYTPSLSNSPANTEMAQHQDNSNGGIEGAEEQLTPAKHIWTRFPNHQHTKLRWLYTNYLSDFSGTTPMIQDAFDTGGANVTATNLLTTDGGAWGASLGANILGPQTIFDGTTTFLNKSGHDFNNPVLIQLRMTTPYSILKSISGNGLTNNAVGYSQPNWLEMFDSKYQFYHVSETEWEITLNFGLPFVQTDATTYKVLDQPQEISYYIFWRYTSNDAPPTSYNLSNANIANVNNSATGYNIDTQGRVVSGINTLGSGALSQQCNPDDYFRMGGFKHKFITLNRMRPTSVKIRGKYKFGQCKMDIKTQEQNTLSATGNPLQTEGWLQSGSTYAFPEDLSLIIVQDSARCDNSKIYTPMGFRMETDQHIEFADLRSAFKYPTPGVAYMAAGNHLNTEVMFFNRGGAYT